MAESEETGMECQVSKEESDDDSSFEVIEDPKNPQVSTYRVLQGGKSMILKPFVSNGEHSHMTSESSYVFLGTFDLPTYTLIRSEFRYFNT